MDTHTTNYIRCCYSIADNRTFEIVQVEPNYQEILKYLNRVEKQRGENVGLYVDMKAVLGILSIISFAAMRSTASSYLHPPWWPHRGKGWRQIERMLNESENVWRSIPISNLFQKNAPMATSGSIQVSQKLKIQSAETASRGSTGIQLMCYQKWKIRSA